MATTISHSPAETFALGRAWAAAVREGAILALTGDLGSGKTQLVRGLAAGLGCRGRVTSPTFALLHEYHGGRLPLFHLDLYRLDTPADIVRAGLEDYLVSPPGVAVVEWAERWFVDQPAMNRAEPAPVMEAQSGSMTNTALTGPGWVRRVWLEVCGEELRKIMYADSCA